MKKQFASLLLLMLSGSPAWAADVPQIPQGASFFTLTTTPLSIEGLTGDRQGNLYTTGRTPGPGVLCPVWRISLAGLTAAIVGYVPTTGAGTQCSPNGIALGANGNLFISEGAQIYTLKPDASSPPIGSVFANGIPGTNGLAFDRNGNLWTGDGVTGQGRVWKISPGGAVAEVFRVQPMANEVNLDAGSAASAASGAMFVHCPPERYGRGGKEKELVEAAGIEPASASPTQSGLHA